jgi:hypothetical protein
LLFGATKVRANASVAVCNTCPAKTRCTARDRGRGVVRLFDANYLDRVRGYHETEANQKAMRKRKVWIEPLFGERSSGTGCGSSDCGATAGQHERAVDRDEAEPEAAPERTGLGTALMAGWGR